MFCNSDNGKIQQGIWPMGLQRNVHMPCKIMYSTVGVTVLGLVSLCSNTGM